MALNQRQRAPLRIAKPTGLSATKALNMISLCITCIFVAVIPCENALVIEGVGSYTKAFGILAFLVTILVKASSKNLPRHSFHQWSWVFVGIILLSVTWSISPSDTLVRALSYVQLIALSQLVWFYRSPRELSALCGSYAVGSAVAVGAILNNHYHGENYLLAITNVARYSALGMDPNDLAVAIALSLPLAAYVLLRKETGSRLWVLLVYCLLILLGIALTASRTGMLTFCVAFVGVSLLHTIRRRAVVLVAGIALGVVVIWQIVPTGSIERIATVKAAVINGELSVRGKVWEAGLLSAVESPVLGFGAGTYEEVVEKELGFRSSSHNTFLSILVELGLVGFIVTIALLKAVVAAVGRTGHIERHLLTTLLLAMAVGVSALTWEYSKVTWLIFGICVAASAEHVRDYKRGRVPG